MNRIAVVLVALMFVVAPAAAQPVPYQHLLEGGMNVAASEAGWEWTDAKQAFKVAAAGDGFAVPIDVQQGEAYFLTAACAYPCAKVGLLLMSAEQQPLGEIVWGETAGEIQLVAHAYTATTTGKLILVTVIADCEDDTCPGGASFYATRSD